MDTDVFKTFSGRLKKVTTYTTKPEVNTTSYRRRLIYDVRKTSDLRRLEDVRFTTSSRRLIYVVLKSLIYVVLKTFDLRSLENVWLTTFWRRLIYNVLKTSVKRRLCGNVVAAFIQRRKKWFFLSYSENFKRFCLG